MPRIRKEKNLSAGVQQVNRQIPSGLEMTLWDEKGEGGNVKG